MAKITFSKLGLKTNNNVVPFKIGDNEVNVKTYLPLEEKAKLIQFVIERAIDINTGVFSPLRIEVYFDLALVKFYTDITFTDKQLADAGKTYDVLQQNGIFQDIVNLIPKDEYIDVRNLVLDTTTDMARFNTSVVGMLQAMQNSSTELNTQLTDLMQKIKSGEGIELLKEIRDIGQDKLISTAENSK